MPAKKLTRRRRLFLSFALSLITIISFVALTQIYFIGLGWLFNQWLVKQKPHSLETDQVSLFLANLLVSGLILNFALGLLIQDIKTALLVGGIFSLFGWTTLFVKMRKYINLKTMAIIIIEKLEWWLLAALLTGLYLILIIGTPLFEWDARSIWFLHGKMIYVSQTISLEAGWQHPSIQFSHVDYPKLIPLMAAQVASVFGYWNEYLPKAPLIFLFIPIILSIISLTYQNKIYLLTIIPIILIGDWLWNGYMDGYLALYFGIAILLGYQFIQSKESLRYLTGITFLVMCLYLKNEGQLVLVVTIIVFSLFLIQKGRFPSLKTIQSIKSPILQGSFLFLPFVVWSYYKFAFNFKNDLQLGSKGFFLRINERLSDPSLGIILEKLIEQIYLPLTIFILLLVTLYFLDRISHTLLIFVGTTLFYSLGILLIYLSTPFDLNYHLRTSIDRTMLPVNTVLWLGALAITQKIGAIWKNNKRQS